MRKLLLTLLVTATFLLAGCTSDDGTDGDGTDDGEPTIAKGASLGEWTESIEGEPLAGAEAVDADGNPNCSTSPAGVGSHPFTVPSANEDSVPWRAKTLTLTLTKANAGSAELDLYLFDAQGNELASNTESDLMGESPDTIQQSNLPPGDYTVEVHACAPSSGYTVDIVGAMVAAQDVYASE